MIWTILILIVAIAMFLFGGKVLGNTGKGESLMQKCINLLAIVLIAGCMVRLVTPYYLTSVNPMILQEMANGYQEQQAAEKNKAIRKAVKSGAECMFIEKYPDVVTVYSIGDVSKELCGGPHVKNTSELGHFKIIKEEASSAGVRRIKAILE